MTIEELQKPATTDDNFSRDGEVVVKMPNDQSIYATASAEYDEVEKRLVITVA